MCPRTRGSSHHVRLSVCESRPLRVLNDQSHHETRGSGRGLDGNYPEISFPCSLAWPILLNCCSMSCTCNRNTDQCQGQPWNNHEKYDIFGHGSKFKIEWPRLFGQLNHQSSFAVHTYTILFGAYTSAECWVLPVELSPSNCRFISP